MRAGGLDETMGNFAGIDDYDFIWTLLEHNATVAIIEKQLYHYRDHDGERLSLGDPEKIVRGLERILEKHQVPERDAKEIKQRHIRWYGKPIYKAMNLD